MASIKGRDAVRSFINNLPEQLATKVLRGAGRAAANVVAQEARERSISPEVSAKIKVVTRRDEGRIIAKVQVKMGGYNLPIWLEYGTAPHFISVSEDKRQGLSVNRINQRTREGSLVIGGNFVGDTVFHPGARPHPFLRPALDIKEADAIRAAQQYVNARVTRKGVRGTDEGDEE